jgi:hypothetical protein
VTTVRVSHPEAGRRAERLGGFVGPDMDKSIVPAKQVASTSVRDESKAGRPGALLTGRTRPLHRRTGAGADLYSTYRLLGGAAAELGGKVYRFWRLPSTTNGAMSRRYLVLAQPCAAPAVEHNGRG